MPGGTVAANAGPNGEYRRQTFVPSLWPFLELQGVYDLYNFNYNAYHTQNTPAVTIQSPVYFCPSDRWGMWLASGQYFHTKGSYIVNGSNCSFTQTNSGCRPPPFAPNKRIALAAIRDGLSSTLFMSEALTPADTDFDCRADFLNDDSTCSNFNTINTPNAGFDSTFCTGATPNFPAPCLLASFTYVSARSQHPGGVQTLFGDGSIHFISDSVSLVVWQALGSMSGGEVIAGDVY